MPYQKLRASTSTGWAAFFVLLLSACSYAPEEAKPVHEVIDRLAGKELRFVDTVVVETWRRERFDMRVDYETEFILTVLYDGYSYDGIYLRSMWDEFQPGDTLNRMLWFDVTTWRPDHLLNHCE